MDLTVFLTAQFLGFALVFARLGATLVFMPGFGEQAVPVRARLLFALALSAALRPATPVDGVSPDGPLAFLAVLGIEITIGLWIGLTARVLLSALQFAGYQIGIVAGLANAFGPQLGSFEGSTMVATGLLMAGVALIFATDLHHLIIAALMMSYDVFPVGLIMPGDLAQQMVRAAAMSFWIGVTITAPFYIMGLLLNLGLGLANKMMPTLPVFFVAVPVLIAAGLLVLAVSGPALFGGFLQAFADWLGRLAF
ncbi:flagellar biosynthetic protein FliR [Roseibacterium sp. SDUM158017]|uniref:flagellar biosynthetic protein FliR n=1 Tax=Roseicyclus salinarum TaxID=3036773 RepID=UPI00241531CB|nr:flagellar biosynthetic protein FliR [Roseibacterium sp. SDUM158017]MDG4648628.1 flagellar biosynthetic protein FliR [Roseibacterium sp. SDUM158017]